ncbi:hypothetical protein BJV82DRAFT_610717 [Fennellomyces sp. T-0311]|nr:hypothetical protein BJV82DRAFT_610717 [Fennellomyces sp. T-0311]
MEFSIPAASSSKRTHDNTNFVHATSPKTPQPRRYYSIKASPKSHDKGPALIRQETAPLPEPTSHTRDSLSSLRRSYTAPEEENAHKPNPRNGHRKSKRIKTWTHDHWKDLSRYYEAVGRNIDKTVKAFYRHESVQLKKDKHGDYDITELWSKDFIKLRVICLNIVTKRHRGVPLLERIRVYNEKKRKQVDEDAVIDTEGVNFKKARRRIIKECNS